MNKELKQRIINFLGDIDFNGFDPGVEKEAGAIYSLLTRKPGRQKGCRKNSSPLTNNQLDTEPQV